MMLCLITFTASAVKEQPHASSREIKQELEQDRKQIKQHPTTHEHAVANIHDFRHILLVNDLMPIFIVYSTV